MKKDLLFPLFGILLLSSCFKEDPEGDADFDAPEILANTGFASIQPEYFFNSSMENREIPLAFSLEDATGIQEIKLESHSGFDGHTHGKSGLNKSSKFKLFSYRKVIGQEQIKNPNKFSYNDIIYLDDRNPEINTGNLILAGPYHFSIQATDKKGNETNYQKNSTYHTTIFIQKPYAPQVTMEFDVSNGVIKGSVYRNVIHEASSDITFLWIYIEEPNNNNQEGTILKELIWGNSSWPHQSRPNSGKVLPDTQQLDIAQLVKGNQGFLDVLKGNTLVFWVEDTNGNITVNHFNN